MNQPCIGYILVSTYRTTHNLLGCHVFVRQHWGVWGFENTLERRIIHVCIIIVSYFIGVHKVSPCLSFHLPAFNVTFISVLVTMHPDYLGDRDKFKNKTKQKAHKDESVLEEVNLHSHFIAAHWVIRLEMRSLGLQFSLMSCSSEMWKLPHLELIKELPLMQICLKLSFHAACKWKEALADFSGIELYMHLCCVFRVLIPFQSSGLVQKWKLQPLWHNSVTVHSLRELPVCTLAQAASLGLWQLIATAGDVTICISLLLVLFVPCARTSQTTLVLLKTLCVVFLPAVSPS